MNDGDQKVIVLRCYAYRRWRDGAFYAECIDLDIAVVRDSMKAAVEALNDAVIGHVEAAAEQGWLNDLVPRPSPFPKRAQYHLLMILFTLGSLFREYAGAFSVYPMKFVQYPDRRPIVA